MLGGCKLNKNSTALTGRQHIYYIWLHGQETFFRLSAAKGVASEIRIKTD